METDPAGNPLRARLRALVQPGAAPGLSEFLAGADSVEVAHQFYDLGRHEQLALLGAMPGEFAAQVLRELDDATMELLLREMEVAPIAALIPSMDPDDAADVVGLLEQGKGEAVSARLDGHTRAAVALLLTYPPDSAGGLMDPDVVRVRQEQTVGEAIAEVRR